MGPPYPESFKGQVNCYVAMKKGLIGRTRLGWLLDASQAFLHGSVPLTVLLVSAATQALFTLLACFSDLFRHCMHAMPGAGGTTRVVQFM